MKGIIFNLLESFISDSFGREVYDEIIRRCDLKTKGPFVGPGTYPDEDLLEIVSKAVAKSGMPAADVVRAFGKYCFPKLAQKYPMFVEPHTHPKAFLKTVESVIHVEVRKLYKDAETPHFEYEDTAPDGLNIIYSSPRKMCHLMEGLIEGVAEHYGVPIRYRQSQCSLLGGAVCKFEMTFGS